MNKNSKILITGQRGLVGSALAKTLHERGYDVYDTGSYDLTGRQETVNAFSTIRPTHVFHCAGRVAGLGGNASTPAQIFIDNIRINTNVVEAARIYGVKKTLCVSSGCVYPSSDNYMYETDLWNGTPHESEAAYAHAKRAMLAHLEAEQKQFGMDFAYAISCNLYGPGDRFNVDYGHVIPSLIAKFHEAKLSKIKPTVWGNGSAIRDFLYVDDAVDALIITMLGKKLVVNIGSGAPHSIKEVVKNLEAIYGIDAVWDKTKPNGQPKRVYETDKLGAMWPAGPKVGLTEGLKKTVEWYDNNYDRARR